jgi:MFS family permease
MAHPAGGPQPQAPTSRSAYFGIGCITAVAGFVGGGMIAVLVAKIVGAFARCSPDAETGAPCSWTTYWLIGAVAGLVLLPTVTILLFARGRRRAQNSERG